MIRNDYPTPTGAQIAPGPQPPAWHCSFQGSLPGEITEARCRERKQRPVVLFFTVIGVVLIIFESDSIYCLKRNILNILELLALMFWTCNCSRFCSVFLHLALMFWTCNCSRFCSVFLHLALMFWTCNCSRFCSRSPNFWCHDSACPKTIFTNLESGTHLPWESHASGSAPCRNSSWTILKISDMLGAHQL